MKLGKGRFTSMTYLIPAVLTADRSPVIRLVEKGLLDVRFVRPDKCQVTTKSPGRFAAPSLAFAGLHASLECCLDPIEAFVCI